MYSIIQIYVQIFFYPNQFSIYIVLIMEQWFSPKNSDIHKMMHDLQHFKTNNFHNYNNQNIVYNKN